MNSSNSLKPNLKWVCLLTTGKIEPIISQLQSTSFVKDFKYENLHTKDSRISLKAQTYNYFFVLLKPTNSNLMYLKQMHGVFTISGKLRAGKFSPVFYNMDNLNNVDTARSGAGASKRKIDVGDSIIVTSGLFVDHAGIVKEREDDNLTVEIYIADTALSIVIPTDCVART